jgi:hypothetical protein
VGESLNVDDVLSGRPGPGRPGNWAVEEYETLTKEPTCPIGPTICGSACCGITPEADGFGQNFRVSFIQRGVGMECGYERGFMLRPIGDAIPLHVRGSESFPCFVLSFHSEQDCLSSFALRKIVPPWAWGLPRHFMRVKEPRKKPKWQLLSRLHTNSAESPAGRSTLVEEWLAAANTTPDSLLPQLLRSREQHSYTDFNEKH